MLMRPIRVWSDRVGHRPQRPSSRVPANAQPTVRTVGGPGPDVAVDPAAPDSTLGRDGAAQAALAQTAALR